MMSICTSIGMESVDGCISCSMGEEMVEIRADLCHFNVRETISVIKSIKCPKILTARGMEKEAFLLDVLGGLEYGELEYMDLELDASREYSDRIRRKCCSLGVKFIVSFHDFKDTPCLDELYEIYGLCVSRGADIVKIVTMATGIEDASRVLQLYGTGMLERPLVAFAMGEQGSFSRRLCLALGAPFTYCSFEGGQATASGQISAREMRRLLDSETYPVDLHHLPSSSECVMPCSKSFAQRAIISASLTPGTSRLRGYAGCDDTESALEVARTLGAEVVVEGDSLIIRGVAPEEVDVNSLDVGESGLLARLMVPLSSLFLGKHEEVRVTCRGTLLRRNLSDLDSVLSASGGLVSSEDGRMPYILREALKTGSIEVDGSFSSQSISGLLMTLPLLTGDSVLKVKDAVSAPYLEMTCRVLELFGIEIECIKDSGVYIYKMSGGQRYAPADVVLEPDWSSAAYMVVAAHLAHYLRPDWKCSMPDLKKGTGQADECVLELVARCGPLSHFVFDASDCPDLFPIAAVLACFCNGVSVIKGVRRLYRKESNRAETILSELMILGASIVIKGDEMQIAGGKLHGGKVISHSDHRIVMALTVAALFIEDAVVIDGMESVTKSFPDFVSCLKNLFPCGMILEHEQ